MKTTEELNIYGTVTPSGVAFEASWCKQKLKSRTNVVAKTKLI
jgi:hypothetical protein